MGLWSDVRLGVSLGILTEPSLTRLDELLVAAMPANLLVAAGNRTEVASSELEIMRAKTVRSMIGGVKVSE